MNYTKYSHYMSRSYLHVGDPGDILTGSRMRKPVNVSRASRRRPHEPELCTRFHRASELLGRRWTGAIIFVLLQSRCRFAALREAIPDITDRMLSDRLRELEAEGVVARTVVPDTPVRVEYALTKKGRALEAPMGALTDWAHRWVTLEK